MFLALILLFLSPGLIIADGTSNPSDTIENVESVDETPNPPTTKYNGPPLYLLSEDEKKQIANGTFVRPEAMPIIQLESGVILDFDGGNLTKRDIGRQLNVYSTESCLAGTYITGLKNFGCSSACFTFDATEVGTGRGVWLWKSQTGNPSPTASMFEGGSCSYESQSVGIASGTNACTPRQGIIDGWQSFIAYFDC